MMQAEGDLLFLREGFGKSRRFRFGGQGRGEPEPVVGPTHEIAGGRDPDRGPREVQSIGGWCPPHAAEDPERPRSVDTSKPQRRAIIAGDPATSRRASKQPGKNIVLGDLDRRGGGPGATQGPQQEGDHE